MRTLAILLFACQSLSAADPVLMRAATVRLSNGDGFCSGICISPDGDILTAEHCQMLSNVKVTFDGGRTATAKIEYDPSRNNTDEAARIKANGTGFPFVNIASVAPKVGDKVSSIGYPHSTFAYLEGKITGIDGHWIRTDMSSIEGHSGGPLFNESGELIGLCSGYEKDSREFGLWIGLESIKKSAASKTDVKHTADKGTVVIFSFADLKRCRPCETLMEEINNGFMGEYELLIFKVDNNGKWNNSEGTRLYREFRSGPGSNENGLPVIWVYGSDKFRSGFDPKGKPSVLSFVKIVIDSLGEVITGDPVFSPPRRMLPAPRGSFDGTGPIPEISPITIVDGTSEEVLALKGELEKLKSDLDKLRNGNVFEKVGALNELRDDVGGLRQAVRSIESSQTTLGQLSEHIAPIKNDLNAIKTGNGLEKIKAVVDLKKHAAEAKELALQAKKEATVDPKAFLLGLFGLFTGLAHEWHRARREVA